MKLFASLTAALCLLLPAGAIAKPADTASIYPEHNARTDGLVNDRVGIMTAAQQAALETKLRAFEHKTHAQIVIVTVPSLHGLPIATYTYNLFERWKPGQAGANNGVIFLIAPNEHRMKIDVGTRLEPYLTDALSKQILMKVRDTDHTAGMPAGIAVGADDIIAVLGPALAQDHNEPMKHVVTKKHGVSLFWIVLIGIFGIGAFIFLRNFFAAPASPSISDLGEDEERARRSQYDIRKHDYPFVPATDTSSEIVAGATAASLSRMSEEETPRSSSDDEDENSRVESSSSDESSSESEGEELGGGQEEGGGAEEET